MTNQIPYPLTTSSQQVNPWAYIEEPANALGVKLTASPAYTAIAVAGDVTRKIDDVEIDVRQAGAYTKYSTQSAGHDYDLNINLNPQTIGILKYGTDPVTNPQSLQFIRVYKQAEGTSALNTYYEFYLGFRCNTVGLSVSSRGLVTASMNWLGREIAKPTQTSGLTTPTIPTFASITGNVLSNVDNGNLPLTVNSVAYAVKEFNINWNNNVFADAFNGSDEGMVDAVTYGPIDISGSFTVPVGSSLTWETLLHDFPQSAVTAKYVVKQGTMVCNMTNFKALSRDSPVLAQPSSAMMNTIPFTCSAAVLGTT